MSRWQVSRRVDNALIRPIRNAWALSRGSRRGRSCHMIATWTPSGAEQNEWMWRPALTASVSTVESIWDRCNAVWRDPRRLSGAYAFSRTRVSIEALFDIINDGASIEELLDWYPGVERWQVESVLQAQHGRLEEVLGCEENTRRSLHACTGGYLTSPSTRSNSTISDAKSTGSSQR